MTFPKIEGRAVVVVKGDTIQPWTYSGWVEMYIRIKSLTTLFNGEPLTAHYIREANSQTLTHVGIKDDPLREHLAMPVDTRRVWWVDMHALTDFVYPDRDNRLHFYYTPSGGYEVPPVEVLDARLTRAHLKRYLDYYISGPGRLVARLTMCEHDLRLSDSCPNCD